MSLPIFLYTYIHTYICSLYIGALAEAGAPIKWPMRMYYVFIASDAGIGIHTHTHTHKLSYTYSTLIFGRFACQTKFKNRSIGNSEN